jgi:outer membrane protein OmpA-like peptidoglycan-associated protein
MAKVFTIGILLFFFSILAQGQSTLDSFIVYFRSNQYVLDSSQKAFINSFFIRKKQILSITGYADTVGRSESNLKLSQKRALSIYSYAVSIGIAIRNQPSYKGEIAIGDLDLKENRRVVVVTVLQKDSTGLEKPTVDKIIQIPTDNIYFLPDLPVLTPESRLYAEKLPEIVASYKNFRVFIVGHINSQSKRQPKGPRSLFELSEKRAKVIFDILAEHGIPKAIMKYKGIGNEDPAIATPRTYDEKTANMRVNIFLLPLE